MDHIRFVLRCYFCVVFLSCVFWYEFSCDVQLAFRNVMFVCVSNAVCESGITLIFVGG